MAWQMALMAAGSVLGGLATLASGYQQAKGLSAQAQAARIEGEMARIRNTQIAAQSREQIATVLGNIDAIRSARGASLDSMTGQAIQKRTVKDAMRAEAMARLAEINRASVANQAARGYSSAARWALPIAGLQALSQGAQGVASAYGR